MCVYIYIYIYIYTSINVFYIYIYIYVYIYIYIYFRLIIKWHGTLNLILKLTLKLARNNAERQGANVPFIIGQERVRCRSLRE